MILKHYKQIIALVAGLTVVVIILLVRLYWQEYHKNNLEVIFMDVGQGDSVLIKTKNNQQILIDGGNSNIVMDRLGRNLDFYDQDLDMIIATHPDADHITGLANVVDRYNVKLFLEPNSRHNTAIYTALKKSLAQKKVLIRAVESRQQYDLGNNVTLDILYPNTGFVDQELIDTNITSIVVKLSDGLVDYLLTGDAPIAVEESLVKNYGQYLDAEILKIGHHGSRTATSPFFLKAVSPEVAIIQVGVNNRYGHPSQSVLDNLMELGIPVLRNDQSGDIKIVSNGEFAELK